MLFHATRHVVGHEALENERYVVIKAYKFTIFEILGEFFVLTYIACPRYPYIESTDSIVTKSFYI